MKIKSLKVFTLKNGNGVSASFTNYGQRLTSLHIPDRNGHFGNVVLGYTDLKDYQNCNSNYFGAIIGRYANRIKDGSFLLDGKRFDLPKNQGKNHLHGGNSGFHNKFWEVIKHTDSELKFSGKSEDMEEGYPGNLVLTVTYSLSEDNELKIAYEATCDRPTYINLTHHSFFNLTGRKGGSINEHQLQINADCYLPIDEQMIPTGEMSSVENTPFDFRTPKNIGVHIDEKNEQLSLANGYDHCYVFTEALKKQGEPRFVAKVYEPESGRTMEVYTNEPGLQFYTGNFLNESPQGKNRGPFIDRSALCLETQHFPDSPNNEKFPSTLLRASDTYSSVCIYKFGVAD